MKKQWMKSGGMKGSRLSVDVWEILVVPVEVVTIVDPILIAGVRVGAQMEPSEKTNSL